MIDEFNLNCPASQDLVPTEALRRAFAFARYVKLFAEARRAKANGGREGIRTLDLSVANAALSQLSYAPTQSITLEI